MEKNITLGKSVKKLINNLVWSSVWGPSYDSLCDSVSALIRFSVCDSVEIIVEESTRWNIRL